MNSEKDRQPMQAKPIQPPTPWIPPEFDAEEPSAPSSATGVSSGAKRFVPLMAADNPEQDEDRFLLSSQVAEPGEGQHRFSTSAFHREDTLLTNAENYALSVRQEVDRYSKLMRAEIEALNKLTENRYAEAERIRQEAQKEALKIVDGANEQVDAAREEARREGFEAGREAGMAKRYEEGAPLLANLEQILKELSAFRKNVAYYAEKDAVRLAVLLAKKVVAAELKVNKKVVWTLLSKTLAALEGKGNFKIWLSPEDHQFTAKALPVLKRFIGEDQRVTFGARKDLGPGNVLIETDRDVIDLTFKNQFHAIESVLNQTLGERETIVLNRPPSAVPPLGEPESPSANDPKTKSA
ncbi:MAG: FliH/SctL family protein [Deltaproteobacteria bacterium]|nr:FliH/SctL family protein [Deltaproteobacteria bacterium]